MKVSKVVWASLAAGLITLLTERCAGAGNREAVEA